MQILFKTLFTVLDEQHKIKTHTCILLKTAYNGTTRDNFFPSKAGFV